MGRKANYPPRVWPHRPSGRDRIRWRGVDYWLGPTGGDQARARYRQLLEEIDRHGAPLAAGAGTPTLTVEQLVDWWAEWAPRNYRPASREPEQFAAPLGVLRELHGGEAAAGFGPRQLKAVRGELGRRYCRNVANRHLVRVKTLFKRAAEEELIPAAVHAGLLAVRSIPPGAAGVRETAPVAAAADADLARVVDRCPAPVAVMLDVARLTGMRPGEVRLMLARQVERRPDGTAVYRRVPEDGHKTAYLGRTRTVILGARAVRVLAPWLHAAAADGGYVFRPADAPKARGRRLGDCYTDNTLPQAVRRAAEAAGVSLRPYQLRHMFKLDALRVGGVGAAMSALGQSTSAAFDRYGAGDLSAAEELARRIG